MYKTFYPFDADVFKRYAELFRLQMRTPIRNFSKGMKRQAFVALALACRPRYLLLDEAFDGLDPLARLELKRGLIELNEQAECTTLISSHSLRELEDVCSGFALLDGGTVADAGTPEEAISRFHKFQVALPREAKREDFPRVYLVRGDGTGGEVCRGRRSGGHSQGDRTACAALCRGDPHRF